MLKLELPVPASNAYGACEQHWRTYVAQLREARGLAANSLTTTVLQRYLEYVRHRGDPSSLGSSPYARSSPEGDLLYDCYASGRGPDREVVNAARSVRQGHCPYCGLRFRRRPKDRHQESDHHLPRSSFPEFSILCINLITACHDCNFHKHGSFANASGARRFLHPYFDACLGQQLLEARVFATRAGVPGVEFALNAAARSSPEAAVVAEHVAHLDLLERMADEVTPEFTLHLQVLAEAKVTLLDAQRILRSAAASRLAPRPNDPLGLTLSAASSCPDLDDLLQEARSRLPP
jgi:hypothetical protein